MPSARCQSFCPKPSGCPGFSLIELLIVLAIIIVLATGLYGFGSRSNQLTQKKKCRSNLQKIYIALQIYAADNHTWFPIVTNAPSSETPLDLLVPRYCSDPGIFVCPGSKDAPLPPVASLRQSKISYAYYMGRSTSDSRETLLSDRQVDQLAKAVGQQAFSDSGRAPGNNHHKFGGNLLFTDGATQASPARAEIPLGLGTNIILLNPKP